MCGGVAGPVVFIAAWAVLGARARADGYEPTWNAISRLAALGAPTRPAMTAALVVLGVGMALYGIALRPRRIWPLPVLNGATALAVAALPLGGGYDTAHGVAAALGDATLAAIPVAVGGRRRGPRSGGRSGPGPRSGGRSGHGPVAASTLSAALLVTSVLVDHGGLLQRAGLTVAHLWVVVSALWEVLASRPTSSSTTPPAPGHATRRR
jgi:hypothetical protein